MNKIYKFMYGRYGFDKLTNALLILSAVLYVVTGFIRIWWLALIPLAAFVLALVRTLSRNISARRHENEVFLRVTKPVSDFFKLRVNMLRDIKTHRYFRCPGCKNALRVPKGKGEITVTCPVCGRKTDRKT